MFAIVVSELPADAVTRNPNGVNVNSNGATTVFIKFGGVGDTIVSSEALWCGEINANTNACVPGTIFGRLPLRFDQAKKLNNGIFSDVMALPPSVARRATQAARSGAASSFFYVRRFTDANNSDTYVVVTCRLAGGGARVPLAFTAVSVEFDGHKDDAVYQVRKGTAPLQPKVKLKYNGTGRLKGRWEVVYPGEAQPTNFDMKTEGTLNRSDRALQQRWTRLESFNKFLPPTGRYTLIGPPPALIPTQEDGLHMLLLRIEVTKDKESDVSLNAATPGFDTGLTEFHGGAAPFAIPILKYYVGSIDDRNEEATESNTDAEEVAAPILGEIRQILPKDGETIPADRNLILGWVASGNANVYRVVINDAEDEFIMAALLEKGSTSYQPPSWLRKKSGGRITWKVSVINDVGRTIEESGWSAVNFE